MPRFYFDILENGSLQIDHDGQDLATPEVAKTEALRTLGAMAAEEIEDAQPVVLVIAVADDKHHIFYRSSVVFEIN